MHSEVITLNDDRFGDLHPNEDAWACKGRKASVADGITRDPIGTADFSGKSREELLSSYPSSSPALKAAKISSKIFVQNTNEESSNLAFSAMARANSALAEFNTGLDVDFLERDYAGCTAAGIVLFDDEFHWASIGDCFVSVIDITGTRCTSPDGTAKWKEYEGSHGGDWNDPEYRRQVRSQFRNNPDQPASYGALTGERAAEKFISSGAVKLRDADSILLYSDGFAELVNHDAFSGQLAKGIDSLKKWSMRLAKSDYGKYGHERTLLVIKP